MADQKFYAVAVGRHVGVYRQWSQAQAETDKFAGACHQSFDTLEDAKEFLTSRRISLDTNILHDVEDNINTSDNTDIGNTPDDETPSDNEITFGNDRSNDKANDSTIYDSTLYSCTCCDNADHLFMLKCDQCTAWYHFECTRLPSYHLSLLRNSETQFTCYNCITIDPEIIAHLQGVSQSSQTDVPDSDPAPVVVTSEAPQTSNKPPVLDHAASSDTNTDTVASNGPHVSCLQAVRDLENTLIEKICDVMKENYDCKVQLINKDLELSKQENIRLTKENTILAADNKKLSCDIKKQDKGCAESKINKLRSDIEQAHKTRHQEYQADKAKIHQALSKCQSTQQHQEAIILEKEKQVSSLQEQLKVTEFKLSHAQDAAYEAKRTQVAVDTTGFTTVLRGNKSSTNVLSTVQPPVQPNVLLTIQPAVQPPVEPSVQPSAQYSSTRSTVQPPAQKPLLSTSQPSTPVILATTQPFARPASKSSDQPLRQSFASAVKSPPRRQQSTPPRFPPNTNTVRPTVVVIGNSHLARIDAARLIPKADVTLLKAYTIHEAADQLERLSFAPSCVVIHEITNDVKYASSSKECASFFHSVIDYYATKFPHTKFVISLGLPRLDNHDLDTKIEMVNVYLKSGIKNGSYMYNNVAFCDHSNFTRNGIPQHRLLDEKDGYHLSDEGTKVLCSNLRCKVEIMLNLRYKRGGYTG